MNAPSDYESKRRELWRALSTRVLTHDELKAVGQYGTGLNIENMVPFNSVEKLQELTNALLIQIMLRASVE